MIEHKYLKLFYRFCKENNLIRFLPKTFDEDLKAIKLGKPLLIVSYNAYKGIRNDNSKESFNNNPFILSAMQSYDADIYYDNKNREPNKKKTFFPESLICLLRKKSRYANDKLHNFENFYDDWCSLINDIVTDDFINFMNTNLIPKELIPYKFYILNYVETYKPKSKNMVIAALNYLKPTIEKKYPDPFDSWFIYERFASLHKAWKNYLLNKL